METDSPIRKDGTPTVVTLARTCRVSLLVGVVWLGAAVVLQMRGSVGTVFWLLGIALILFGCFVESAVRRQRAQARRAAPIDGWPRLLEGMGLQDVQIRPYERSRRQLTASGQHVQLTMALDLSTNALSMQVKSPALRRLFEEHGAKVLLATGDDLPAELVARYDEPTRQSLAAFQRVGMGFESAGLTHRSAIPERVDELTDWVTALMALGEALSRPIEVAEALAQNAIGNPSGGVRLRNLDLLVAGYAETPAAREAARCGMADAEPGVALTAAIFFAHAGIDRVIELLQEDRLDAAQTERAAHHLAITLPHEEAVAVLNRLAERGGTHQLVLRRALEGLATTAGGQSVA
jgi:hypothetical protein